MKIHQALPLHPCQFVAHGAPVHIQVIRQLLSVKGNVKHVAGLPEGLGG